ncbi:MAG: nucleotide exchange factor GrpE [Gammaproteobacteria bacterium]|nr:nucleotide exchange factor GrpE [Gammaproteobacteria bacterium]NNC67743.1 nucleotide exchange factor GrpE [Gammaproteobacteria bacterium]
MTNSEQNVETDDSIVNEPTHEHENAQPHTEASESNVNEREQEVDKQLEEAQQQVVEYHDKILRMQAEMDNLRKRTERDVSNAHKYAVDKFANELLQVKDSLELGLSAEDIDVAKLQEGTELTLKMLSNAFEKFSIEELNPVGEAFDPNLHEAMTMQESTEHEPNTVLTVMQKGYTLHGRLIRPAMVIVAKAVG